MKRFIVSKVLIFFIIFSLIELYWSNSNIEAYTRFYQYEWSKEKKVDIYLYVDSYDGNNLRTEERMYDILFYLMENLDILDRQKILFHKSIALIQDRYHVKAAVFNVTLSDWEVFYIEEGDKDSKIVESIINKIFMKETDE
jgi:hypothetical protein